MVNSNKDLLRKRNAPKGANQSLVSSFGMLISRLSSLAWGCFLVQLPEDFNTKDGSNIIDTNDHFCRIHGNHACCFPGCGVHSWHDASLLKGLTATILVVPLSFLKVIPWSMSKQNVSELPVVYHVCRYSRCVCVFVCFMKMRIDIQHVPQHTMVSMRLLAA